MFIVTKPRGFALQDVLVLCICAILFVMIASVVRARPVDDGRKVNPTHPLSLKDQKYLEAIMITFTMFAESNKGRYPIPGLINRHAADLDGDGKGDQQLIGVGPEDVTLNITANLYSAMIAQCYFNPNLLISPIERNQKVKEDSDYEMSTYSPAMDVYWDSKFAADLEKLSNTSYAHLPISGQRKVRIWKFNKKSPNPILSNRGPKDGKADPKSNTCSPQGYWHGNVAYSDGHAEFLSPTVPNAVPMIRLDNAKMDNIFADDGIGGEDTILAFTKAMKEMNEGGPVLQYD